MLPRLTLACAIVAVAIPAVSLAQPPASADLESSQFDAPAYVAVVDGAATLEREGRDETSPLNMPLLSGDRLRTADGRVEVRFADGSTIHLDAGTTLDIQSDELVRLLGGRVRVHLAGASSTGSDIYRIDSEAGSVRITQAGEYRVALLRNDRDTQIELAVIRGAAEVFTDEGSMPVRAGERAYASAGLAPSYPLAYNSAAWDAFDRWSEAQRDAQLGASAEYLPDDMRGYAPTFDEYGDWRYDTSYGYVWYPRVAADWRPYYYGRWVTYPRYGWTWIGADRFAWPTHHYGRWGISAGVWFWIPSNRWAPAYVSWAYAPDYVSWCPLGWNNRAVISIDLFNVGPGYYRAGRGYASAWTAVPSRHFGRGFVQAGAVDWARVDHGSRPRFTNRGGAPRITTDVAVSRGSATVSGVPDRGSRREPAPIRSAGARAANARTVSGATTRGAFDRGNGAASSAFGATAAPRRDPVSPRYINRGDTIVRSQTERPTPPRQAAPDGARTAVPRDPRIAAQPVGRRFETGSVAQPTRTGPLDRPAFQAPRVPDRAIPRGGTPMDAPAYAPNYAPNYSPNFVPNAGRSARPPARSYSPDSRAPGRSPGPQPGPQSYQRGPSPQPPRAQEPSRGRWERSAPSGGRGVSAPAVRPAPAPAARPSAVPRAGSRPRGGGGAR